MIMHTPDEWDRLEQRVRTILGQYLAIGPAGERGALMIYTKLDLYDKGDRSDALYESLEEVK